MFYVHDAISDLQMSGQEAISCMAMTRETQPETPSFAWPYGPEAISPMGMPGPKLGDYEMLAMSALPEDVPLATLLSSGSEGQSKSMHCGFDMQASQSFGVHYSMHPHFSAPEQIYSQSYTSPELMPYTTHWTMPMDYYSQDYTLQQPMPELQDWMSHSNQADWFVPLPFFAPDVGPF